MYFLTREFDLIRLKESVTNISLGLEFDILEEEIEIEKVELKDISKLLISELEKLKLENEYINNNSYELFGCSGIAQTAK